MKTRIGSFASTTLAGEDLAVPAGLRRTTLIVFAYRQWQQVHVDTWLRVVAGRDDVDVLEVPVLNRRWIPARPVIDGGMASNMDATTRAQTMCVYTNVGAFKDDVLGVRGDDVVAALVEPSGEVRWHGVGQATSQQAEALLGTLDD